MRKNTQRTTVFSEALPNLQLLFSYWLRLRKKDEFIGRQNINAVL